MDRRKSLKLIGGSVVGVAGLVFADWKWQIIDQLTHEGFFSLKEEQTIRAIADTIIPEGLPPILPSADAKPIGALSTGTHDYINKVIAQCYEPTDQELVKKELQKLINQDFLKLDRQAREKSLLNLESSEIESEVAFFKMMKSETITGFTTVKEVMVNYRNYQVAPGFYNGCVEVTQKA
ncbi:gluconate 2-dehydrogenase subunit 3 family protein [Algoriphagus marinus]|uniref:gluconate 2-dehydrogenase subunit 3 family protein n=1 Tax=Algoriphagus marinus TaxID=1925762 RepID=UPI00094BA29D|nr:gluconate 2-dehydrogenase subunit 3 family protein [Algoriphagus marinus]